MKKNTASQVVGVQLTAKADGSAVTTGTTTVYVTGDGGGQAVGSVASGACTHEGNGFWTYAPAQAETNYDHVAFTFVNTNAINVTVQIYPSFPQTGDAFARLGAPAGASVSADVAAIKTQTAAIETDTQDLQSRTPAALVGGRMDSSVGAVANNAITAAAIANDAITAAKIADGAIDAATFAAGAIDAAAIAPDAIGSSELAASAAAEIATAVRTELATELGRVDVATSTRASQTSLDTLDAVADAILVDTAEIGAAGAGLTALASAANLATVDSVVDGIKAKTDNLPSDPADASDIASSFSTVNSAIATLTGYVDTEVGAIKAVTDKLDDTLEDDGGTYRFTTNALEQAPTGGSAPTVTQIADEVQTRTIAGVTTVGSVTGAVGSVTGNVGGNVVGTVASVVGAVGSVTGNVGGNVAGSVGSLAAQAKADVNAEVDTALADYDAPTFAELDTRTDSIDTALGTAIAGISAVFARTDVATSTRAAAGDAMALTVAERGATADKLLGRNLAGGSDGGRTVRDSLRPLRNRTEISGGTLRVYEEDDMTEAWNGATTTAPGDPITSINPA